MTKKKKESIELHLPTEQLEFLRAVAKLADVSFDNTVGVLLAMEVLRLEAKDSSSEEKKA